MGFFDKMKDAQAQAQEAMASSQGAPASPMGGGGMGGDMTGQVAYAQLMQKLAQSGSRRPG